ncbi:aminoglycoside phosphotransferase family protein (plasmid) [Streptomyces sp. NBC_01601]
MARGRAGDVWFVKVHQNPRFHGRALLAHQTWVPHLGTAASQLVAEDAALLALVVTAVPGRPLHNTELSPDEAREVFRRIGILARRIHSVSPPRPAPPGRGPAVEKADRHLLTARPHLAAGDEEFVRSLVRQAVDLAPLDWVETHGDFQLRNILRAKDSSLAVIDFERSEPGPAVRDVVRLSYAWAGRPDLREAFLAGYGRPLTENEKARLVIDTALDAVSGIQYSARTGDTGLVQRGQTALVRLRTDTASQESAPGEAS